MAGVLVTQSLLQKAVPSILRVRLPTIVHPYLMICGVGRGGVSNQPWQGSWRSNVSVQLTTCNLNYQERRPIRYLDKLNFLISFSSLM